MSPIDTPEDGFARLRDPREWDLALEPRADAVVGHPASGARTLRRPLVAWSVGVGATAALAVLALVVGLGIRDAREVTPPAVAPVPSETATPAPSATPTPSSTPTGSAPPDADPRTSIADETSCRAVLTGDADAQAWIDPLEFVANYPDIKKDEVDNGVYPFIQSGGLVCAWSTSSAMEVSGVMASGAISAADAASRMAALDAEGIDSRQEDGWIRYDEREGYPGGYAFADGFWVWVFVNAEPGTDEPDFLADVVANQDRIRPLVIPNTTGTAVADDPDAAATPANPPYLTSEGLGPLRIGQPIPDDNGFVTWDSSGCSAGHGLFTPMGDFATGGGDDGGGPAFTVRIDGGEKASPLEFIVVRDERIPTKSGIRVGDSEARVKATYDSFDAVEETNGERLYVIEGAAGKVVIDVSTGHWDTAAAGTVVAIAVVPIDASLGAPGAPTDAWTPCQA
ncbi:hypothetical protein QT381_13975 [Galbitalea sp. SE-J8]|uniref:hypothetical protein n=1 Tax=Galbitalea sp. SE-J8 TaxID=3054952 RepID=UPI00259CD648|nr:hypothetical protein [Galbitalea sp. SE-J8]MDM4764115.1 hypothetical protein [Galbitalea sp. SE-J8]